MLSSALLISLALVISLGKHSTSDVRLNAWESLSQRQCPATPMGALPRALDVITAREFAVKVRALRRCFDLGVPDEHERLYCAEEGNKCKGGPSAFPAQHARMSIFPIDDSHTIDPDNLPPNGLIIAKIHNIGGTRWGRYPVPDDDGIAKNYYLVLTDDGAANEMAKIHIVGIRRAAETTGYATALIPVPTNEYYRVCHKHTSTAYPEAQFSDCEVSPQSFPSPLRDNDTVRVLLTEHRLFQPRSPGTGVWLRCSLGCCSTGPLR